MELSVKISKKEDIEKFVSVLALGIIEAIINKTISIEEAGYYFLRPYSAKIIEKKGADKKLVDLIYLLCELEDVESIIPHQLEESMDDAKNQICEFMKSIEKPQSVPEYWIENNISKEAEETKRKDDKIPSENKQSKEDFEKPIEKQSYALIDLTGAKNIYDVHERISTALDFPGRYEKTLEALWDMLKRYETPLEIRLKGAKDTDAVFDDLAPKVKRIVETFKEAEAKFGYISVVLV